MRIDFSEPECRNCFHCRTLGILNTQESEPSNVIGSSVTSMPVNSGPVQALEHDSAAVGSTSTSSPVQALGHDDSAATGSIPTFSFGSQTPSVCSEPVQTLAPTSLRSDVFGSPFQATSGSGASATFTSSTSSPFQSSSPNSFGFAPAVTLVSSAPTQAFGPNSFAFGASATSSTSSPVQSSSPFGFAPAVTSVSSAPTQAFGQTAFGFGSSLNSFGFAPAVTSVSSAPTQAFGPNTCGFGSSPNSFGFSPAVTSVSSAPTQAFGQTAFCFGSSPNSFGFAPAVTSVSSAPTQAFGQTAFGFGSSPNSFGFAPAVTSVSSAPTQAFGPNTCGFNLFAAPTQPTLGSMQAPVQATSGFGAFTDTTPPRFGLGSTQAPVKATFSSGASGTSTSYSFLPFGSIPPPPRNASSLFGPMQGLPWTTNSLPTEGGVDWVRSDVGVFPATSSSNLFGPNPSTPTEVFGAKPGSVSWPGQDYPRTGVNRFALHSSPSNRFGQNISTTGSNSGFPGFGVDYLPGSTSNPFGLNPYTTGGGSIFDGPKTSSPQPFGLNAATNPLPSSSLSSPATFSSNPNTGFNSFYVWSHRTEQGSSYPRYAPTPDEVTGGMYTSISASKAHQHKSHEELRWEDYKQGNKGSRTNTVFGSPPMAWPSIFASPSILDQPQRTTFGTTQESFTGPFSCFPQHNPAFTGFGSQFPNSSSSLFTTFPPISSSVQRPHETAAVSSPASGCTACGATTSTSASGYSTFNGATLTPPSAATTSLPRLFYLMYGSVPMMFGTSPAAQVTTPALQAYPVNGYFLLPFAAMNLQ